VILGAAACNSDGAASIAPPLLNVVEDGPVVPVVQVETARPGQNLPVLFRNRVNQEFWFNPCERFIERNVGGTRHLPIRVRDDAADWHGGGLALPREQHL
jgi:hypothetical protein